LALLRSSTDHWVRENVADQKARQHRCYELLQENMNQILPWLSSEVGQGEIYLPDVAAILNSVDKKLQVLVGITTIACMCQSL
jgi:bifunctional N-acetylglucosamine-1-phosphate-uridyltransferase/glucosamine-1-phosphate-acetyltransferase GlmU-like protein